MDFIIQNIGWFVGFLVIVLLALIGSYADKKEKKNNINTNKEEMSKENIDKVNETPSVNEIPIVNEISNTETHENKDNFGIKMPEFKNIEDAHMSLADLEKANYEAIINNKQNNNEVYEDLSVPFEPIQEEQNNNEVYEDLSVPLEPIQEEQNNNELYEDLSVPLEPIQEEQNNSEVYEDLSVPFEPIQEEQNIETTNQEQTVEEQEELNQNELFFGNKSDNEFNGVPELGDMIPINVESNINENNYIDSEEDILDENIWKF